MREFIVQLFVLIYLLSVALGVSAQENRYIAYVALGDTANDIFVVDLSDGVARNLTNNPLTSVHPTWSSNGQEIAYVNVVEDNPELFVMEANGLNPRNVSNHPSQDLSPDWSPTANEIVFVSDRDGGADLYLLTLADNTVTRLTTDGRDKNRPDYSPDGKQVAYWQINGEVVELKVIDIETGEITTLVDSGQNLWPAWSPDGSSIAVHSQETGTAQIWIVDIATGERTQVTLDESNNFRPEWSPDGSQIIFVSDRNGGNDLYIMNADGTNQRPLLEGDESISPSWRRDTSFIDFAANPQLGQGAVKVEQDSIGADDQSVLGEGSFRVFAPEVAGIDEVVHIRLEVGLANVELVPSLEDTPIRAQGETTLYRYMGAELSGRDMEFFDVHPTPTAYLLQIDEDDTNYWDWFLIPTDDAVGDRFFIIELYLPDIADDGVVTKEVVETIIFDIEMLKEAPPIEAEPTEAPVASAGVSVTRDNSMRQKSVVPEEPTEGFSIYLNDENILAIAFSNEVDVSDMRVASQVFEIGLGQTFPDIEEFYNNVIPPDFCVLYEIDSDDPPALPLSCQAGTRLRLTLNAGDVFWYSVPDGGLIDVTIRKNGKTFVCSPTFPRCDF